MMGELPTWCMGVQSGRSCAIVVDLGWAAADATVELAVGGKGGGGTTMGGGDEASKFRSLSLLLSTLTAAELKAAGGCWVSCRHCSNYKARGASGNYKAWGASGNYEAQGVSGGKYEARMVIFHILATVNRFSQISWKEESR